jgi:hypothetical protein
MSGRGTGNRGLGAYLKKHPLPEPEPSSSEQSDASVYDVEEDIVLGKRTYEDMVDTGFASSSSGFSKHVRKEEPVRKTVQIKKATTKRIEGRRATLSEEKRRTEVKHGHSSKYNVLSRMTNLTHVRKIA